MMNKRGFRLALVFLLIVAFVPYVSAQNFTVDFIPSNNIITTDDAAVFDINVRNNGETADRYKISLNDDLWSVSSKPLYVYQTQYGLEVNPNSAEQFQLFLYPIANLSPGIYKVPVEVESLNEQRKIKETLFVIVKPAGASFGEYVPTVRVTVKVGENGMIDPRNETELEITMENLNPLNISEMYVDITSTFFQRRFKTSLDPLEKKTEKVIMNLNPVESPKKTTINIAIIRDENVLKVVRENVEILAYSDLTVSESVQTSFFKRVESKKYANIANIKRGDTIKLPVSTFDTFFVKTYPEATIIEEGGKKYLTWFINLKPHEQYEIEVAYNYRLPFVAILIIIVALSIYYALRSPVVIRKEGEIIRTAEGGISELKVLIYVKNRSKNAVSKVKIMDKIPNIADVKDDFIVGTMKPTKVVKHDKKGTLLEWEIPALDAFEERIVSYKIKSKLSILGFFNLPPAVLKFRDEKNRERVSVSNKLRAVT